MSKTITISDETYEFIQNFCKQLAEQDSRSTRMPYVYAIRDIKRIYGMSWEHENSGHEWHNDYGDEMFNDEEFIEHLKDENLDLGVVLDSEDEWCGFTKYYYQDIKVVKNMFLTEKAAQEHLVTQHYHYDDPSIKVIHLHGNNEIMNLIISLNEIK